MADDRAHNSRWMYDVFLSFRGEDTRKNFTDHLYYALRDGGINVFRDDKEIRLGEDITTELQQAIQKSKIAIIVFSNKYADSRWCLEELVKIMECRRTLNQLVLPIFYDVDPSDVRNQKGSFEEAFHRHQLRFVFDNDKILRWRIALAEASNLSGWDFYNADDRHEGNFIRKIVEEISRDLNRTCLFVAHHPIGIDCRVDAITSKLDVGLGGVRMIGIWGMGGVGKTTIAKEVYNQLYHNFEGACFLANVKDISKQPQGQVWLQEQLLMAIFKSTKIELTSVDQGIIQLQKRLHHHKLLLVLDDIDDMSQVNVLARSHDWFGAGSRIIITTRDEHLLKNLQVDAVCTVCEMNEIEALELFSWHAFHNNHPSGDYYQLSKCVVNYCGGLPLALEVLGSFLYGRIVLEWEDALNKLMTIPHDEIQRKLKISFDGLEDQTYKDIFLDVSCFFIGMDKNEVTQILDGCGFFSIIGIQVLLERCLLKIDEENKFVMHNLVRDMGREIVREESPKEPNKRSRLFLNEEVLDVLKKQQGTNNVTEGLSLKLPRCSKKFVVAKALIEMQKLRLLQLNYAHIVGGHFEHLSQELRWLCWHGFPLKFLPENLYLEKIVAIDLRYSQLRFMWKKPKFLEKLTVLNLSHSHYLTHTPNFLKLPNLEKLKLKDCKSLVKVDDSIGSLKKLVFINLKGCIRLNKLPVTLCELKSLETLIVSGCSKLESLPKDLEKMESLTTLAAEDSCIQQLPSTIVKLKRLKYLSLSRCKRLPSKSVAEILLSWILPRRYMNNSTVLPSSLRGLESLTTLCLKSCNLSEDAIPKDIGSLVSLVELDLQDNGFYDLPSSIGRLSKLKTLRLDDCTKLKKIPNLPPNLKTLIASKCKVLESISDLSKIEYMHILQVNDCPNLVEIQGLEKLLPFIGYICMMGSSKMKQSFKETILQGWMISGFGVSDLMTSGLGAVDLPICDYPTNDSMYSYRGIRNEISLGRYIFPEDGRSLYLEAAQIIDFDVEGLIMCRSRDAIVFYTKGVIPIEEARARALTMNDAVNLIEEKIWESQLKVEDGVNHIIHFVGHTSFDLGGWSSARCAVLLSLEI